MLKASELIAKCVNLPAATQAVVEGLVLRSPKLRPHLAANPNLSRTAWFALMGPKPKPTIAMANELCARPLDAEQRALVLASETRTGPLSALVHHNVLGPAEQELLVKAKGFTASLAGLIVESDWATPAIRRQAAYAAGGQVLLDRIATAHEAELDAAECQDLLARFSEWGAEAKFKQRSTALSALLNRNPHLMATAARPGQHNAVQTAAAGCRHLTELDLQYQVAGLVPGQTSADPGWLVGQKFLFMALVNNPVCHEEVAAAVMAVCATNPAMAEVRQSISSRRAKNRPRVTTPFEEVDDLEILDWLVFRALPSEFKTGGRPWDLLALASNPHLNEVLGHKLAGAFSSPSIRDALRAAVDPDEVFLALIQRFPDERMLARMPSDHASEPYDAERLARLDGSAPNPGPAFAETRIRAARFDLGYLSEALFAAVVEWLGAQIGPEPAAWDIVLSMADDFDGTVEELAEMATLVGTSRAS